MCQPLPAVVVPELSVIQYQSHSSLTVQRYRVQLCCVRRICLGMQTRTGYPSFVSLHIDMMQSENGDSFGRPAHNIYTTNVTYFMNMLIHAFVTCIMSSPMLLVQLQAREM